MLRAWSEPGGIVQLPNLERVHIHQVQVRHFMLCKTYVARDTDRATGGPGVAK